MKKIIGLYSTHKPIEPGSKFYPRMWFAKYRADWNPPWFVGTCWWKFWRTYNPRGCTEQIYNRPEWIAYRTTLFGRPAHRK